MPRLSEDTTRREPIMTDRERETVRQQAVKMIKIIAPTWAFNAAILTVAYFAYAWTRHHQHWAEYGWLAVIYTSALAKMILSAFLLTSIYKYAYNKETNF